VSVTACVVVSVTACVVAGDLTHPGTDATTRVRHDAKTRLEDGGDDGDVGSVPELNKENGSGTRVGKCRYTQESSEFGDS